MNLLYWLRKSPQPAAVLADDKRIEIPKNARAWRDLTATITSLEPSKLTALDGHGNVIRSIVLESDEDDKAPASPEMTDLQFFARLLSEGYEKGMKANQPIVDSAMQFVERQSQRLAKAEAEIDRLRGVIHKLQLQNAELSNQPVAAGGEDSILGALVSGAMQAGGAGALAQVASIAPKGAPKK